eukprot:Polyplicarium_translucidae@DN1109_c0_g1_i1.p2
MHTSGGVFACEQCSKRCPTPSELKTHMRSHNNGKQYDCKGCQSRFKTESSLSRHVKSGTCGKRKVAHVCPNCCKSFAKKGNLGSHMKVHSEERPHRCEFCESSYKNKSSLTRHKDRAHPSATCSTKPPAQQPPRRNSAVLSWLYLGCYRVGSRAPAARRTARRPKKLACQ